ncbi:Mannose-6-phosphate isomerase [Corynebacterium afermentans subsp. afermentans]|uniref:mannose-6-phosphate isomerase n=1 Tax=Corynebacterium afermentans TaxID=38286 RepID=A0A9X8R122_9CORY|nr:mannose-6-phosphate isomerase, class I [Corynebacterium afermentans]OAA16274.1 mannose-6-phosphate isomerase [Corynebacterium afermentans subsp. afermentans]WJY56141.1 Mannose-6-phosphate isomerase [Corynebacterium afermentans subsp. afermentans]SIP96883.1 mannose-6-phosphate isomerase, type 1 [Corynebacterium afermentans]
MEHLEGALRPYPWGSHTLIAQLRGEPSPSPQPQAELWFGAHPAAPATVNGQGLDEAIAADPAAALGKRVTEAHGDQLPFLVKLLAAAAPLSIQAHPSLEQAQEGFARENTEGIALNSPNRNYKDPNHKPELIVALTEFRALAGFRPVPDTAAFFAELGSAELDRYATLLPTDGEGDLRALFTTLISLPHQPRVELIESVQRAAAELVDQHSAPAWMVDAAEVYLELNRAYPGDVGVLAALLLNVLTLAPGEAAFLRAGQLHAYLSGLGVEVMANSDNVLRGGLTTKHVDVPELVKVLDFSTLENPRAEAAPSHGGVEFQLPVDSFAVRVHSLAHGETLVIDEDGPAIVLCTSGEVRGADGFVLSQGNAAWAPASEREVQLTAEGAAQVFVATA